MSILEELQSGNINFADAVSQADEVPSVGFDIDLIKEDRLKDLVNVPFLVVGGTFRNKISEKGEMTDFVTIICVLADENTLLKRKISLNGKSVIAGSIFGINDGSTGLRRQMVSYLHKNGYIDINPANKEFTEGGGRGLSDYDQLVNDWADHKIGDLESKEDKKGNLLYTWDFKLPNGLVANNGLRLSTYKGAYGKTVTTKYLA
jgi:hypothetical protein